MDTKQIHEFLKKICIKLRNDNVGNLEIAYIEGADPRKDPTVMSVIFITFEDMNPIGTEKYFKLAFQSDAFELRPTINNQLADPMLLGLELYEKVKDYYLQWRKQQSAGAPWASQSKATRTYAREDAKQTASLAKLAALEDAFDKSFGKSNTEANKSKLKNLGTPRHTSAPWEDPVAHDIKARDLAKQYSYMMEKRMDYVYKAVKLLQTKRKLKIDNPYLYQGEDDAISCDLTEHINRGIYKIRNYYFDISDRMFSRERHLLDNSVHIPAEETYLSEGHLILRLAYIIYKATQLRDRERINNEVIKVHNIELREDIF